MPDVSHILVVAPNFKRRLSGVTSTIVQLVPKQAETIAIATLGPGLPDHLPKLHWLDLPKLRRRPKGRRFRVWHARRNVEMLAGVVMRDLLRMPLKLLFTSAAQRHHTGWTRFLISRMDGVVATSERSRSYLKAPARVVMHGIDCESFSPDGPMPSGDLAASLEGRRIVGCSGRIRHQKGTDLFVEAMIALLPSHPDWTAVITGRVTAENRAFATDLEGRIAAAGLKERILFAGEVDDIAAWFRRFDLYVAPPRNEGFGLTPLEAMASRTPVVASDAGAFAELIVEGVTGRVVPAGDAGALASAIAPFLSDETMRLAAGTAGLEHVRAKFPLEREAMQLGAVYEALWTSTP
ncbi:glycosyltransferase family 4 protein [Jiella mangrovi]|uniref:Glycosyltransferase family 4 protein n=1 Tax=Jiella mangrovi TaxID=2821407 RepID=A0ABS4BJT2_9HYPH|nr:glycosyltransferase family 4 protein [Jiella mangrovi]MBP0616966.1 glycosyltransferase family 4 protein [Jiella mangrovi]